MTEKFTREARAAARQAIVAQANTRVDRILRGTASEFPVQMPVKYLMIVNLQTAKALGVVVPPAILLSADDVIE